VSEAIVSEAMLVERVEESKGSFVATGREVDGADEKAVMAAWRDLCAARRGWFLNYREELCSTHEGDSAVASEAHKRMVGPAQEAYERMVGAQMIRTIPSGSSVGVGEILYK
jgi:hypothetical protein